MRLSVFALASLLLAPAAASADAHMSGTVTVGPRPYALIDRMQDGDLKTKLLACAGKPVSSRTAAGDA